MSEEKKQLTYADAGVDIDAGNRAVELMKDSVRASYRPEVIGDLGGFGGLALVYGPFMLDPAAFKGLLAAQAYHAARSGFDPVWTVGSVSRLVRWYLPVFIVLGLGIGKSRGRIPPRVAILLGRSSRFS